MAITTSLCAAVCAISFGGAAAFAEADGDTEENTWFYPATFLTDAAFDKLDDYAVGDGKYAFLQDNVIYEYGSESSTSYNIKRDVSALYFENGEFYYRTKDDKIYKLLSRNENENPEVENFTDTTVKDKFDIGEIFYSFDANGILTAYNSLTRETTEFVGFKNLKKYDGTAYAVNENVLYTLNGAEAKPVKIENFTITKDISVGGAYAALTSSATGEPQFVDLTDGAYMTEVDLDKLTKTSLKFETGDTQKVDVTSTSSALLLYQAESDNNGISIVAVKDKCYLIHPKDTTPRTVYAIEEKNLTGTLALGYIYSAPYECTGTQVTELLAKATVKILGEVKKDDDNKLQEDFYYVEYQDGDDAPVKGYVRLKLVSNFVFNEDPPKTTTDPEETYDDMVKPVVLVLVVLLLVFIAVGYLIYVGTSDKRKHKKIKITEQENKKQ